MGEGNRAASGRFESMSYSFGMIGLRRPGPIGDIPYLLVLRAFIAAGIVLRLFQGWEYNGWAVAAAVATVLLAALLGSATAFKSWPFAPGERLPVPAALAIIAIDTAVIFAVYVATGSLRSDAFLFFFLPILTAAEYLPTRLVIAVFLAVSAAFLGVIYAVFPIDTQAPRTFGAALLRVFAGREFFLFGLVSTAWYLFESERQQQKRLDLLLSSLRAIDRATLKAFAFDSELNETLRELTEELHMEFGSITLKDDYRGMVETVRGRNVPPGLLRLSRYRIGEPDIQNHVIETGQTMVLDGNHDLLNQEIFEFFEHGKLARIWAPMRNGQEVIGTVEAGCAKERKELLLADDTRRRIEALAARKGKTLCELRPQALLGLIAEEAIRLADAESASIHVFQAPAPLPGDRVATMTLKEFTEHFHSDEPVLAAGAGKAGPEFIRKYAPRPNGAGWKAMLAAWRGDPDVCQNLDGERLRVPNSEIWALGIQAMLAIPLRVSPTVAGVLYVHRWKRRRFTERDIQVERVFAAQIEVAIQSYLLLRQTALAAHDSRSLLDWLRVMQSQAPRDAGAVLAELAQTLLLVADADNVVLYQYVEERSEFLRPILKGKFREPGAMRLEVESDHLIYQLGREALPKFYDNIAEERSSVAAPRPERPRFVEREGIQSCAILELRARSGDELFGILFVNYRTRRRFTEERKHTMQALAASAAAVIRAARFHTWLQERQQHIDSLHEIDKTIVEGKGMDLDQVLAAILTGALLTARAWAGAIFVRDPEDRLEARAAFPPAPVPAQSLQLAEASCASKKPEFLSGAPDVISVLRSGSRSCLALPLLDGDTARGALYVETDRRAAFTAEDARVLEALAVQAMIAIHTIESYGALDMEKSRAEALSLVAKEIQNSGHSLDAVLYLILTGITAGESLGFSRAMLFERSEGGAALRGRCAVGSTDLTRAKAAWEDTGQRSCRDALDTAIQYFRSGAADGEPLLQAVRGMEIPLDDAAGAIGECVLNRSNDTRYVEAEQADSLRARLLPHSDGQYDVPFACIPLVGRKENIGAVVVDNRFRPGEMGPLSREMTGRVAAFAELAAMSIETARLLEKTQIQTYEDLAHQLRGPINKAGQYCDELTDGHDAAGESSAAKLDRLRACIHRAEHVSNNLHHYAKLGKGEPLQFEPVRIHGGDLLRITRESIRDFEIVKSREFHLRDEGFSALNELTVTGDLALIQEALENLLDNAVKYSYRGTAIEVGAEAAAEPCGFLLYVKNQGIPLTAEEVKRVAERGWRGEKTRWVAAGGSGIGLWVVDGIMRGFGGRLSAEPTTEDNRTRIGLWFPAAR